MVDEPASTLPWNGAFPLRHKFPLTRSRLAILLQDDSEHFEFIFDSAFKGRTTIAVKISNVWHTAIEAIQIFQDKNTKRHASSKWRFFEKLVAGRARNVFEVSRIRPREYGDTLARLRDRLLAYSARLTAKLQLHLSSTIPAAGAAFPHCPPFFRRFFVCPWVALDRRFLALVPFPTYCVTRYVPISWMNFQPTCIIQRATLLGCLRPGCAQFDVQNIRDQSWTSCRSCSKLPNVTSQSFLSGYEDTKIIGTLTEISLIRSRNFTNSQRKISPLIEV